ncbi:MAG: ubiquitin-conjugating enzyme E2-17 kDa [Harvfovirus sp.]|uniref:E2 ubiquitin-conjugating enzyme n=1 Tax=Harvfovirus sp. TaxID=2487768 RepID=A0A3G5A0D8_9VIRU|nr:MAG: ubiquitin-conjugating enzyme E2-17 kDa [Harvfovirus sp.]
MSLRRIQKESDDIQKLIVDQTAKNGFAMYTALPLGDDLYKWTGNLNGPIGSPYEAGVFFLDIQFPPDYPFKPPKIKFETKIFHPNIKSDGSICISLLKESWSPSVTLYKVLSQIFDLLTNPDLSAPLSPEVAEIYNNNRTKFNEIASEWTKKYAA